MIFPFGFMLFVPDPSVVLVWPIYLVGLTIHRFGHWRAKRRRAMVHTHYQGDPWVAMFLFRLRDPVKAWTIFEPLLAVLIGFALSPLGEGLALYYIFGGIAMFVKQLFENVGSRQRLDQFHDAMIENDYMMSQSRGLRRFA
jgi:membrane protein insertase Oxa1/YidC/SpoIIIJ